MRKYFAGIGTHRPNCPETYRLIETVEETPTRYHELWAISYGHGQYVYQIRTLNIRPDTRVEWAERDFYSLDDAAEKFDIIKTLSALNAI